MNDTDPARQFEFEARVPYAHVDKMGFMYYANHFIYFEMARTALLREVGLPYTLLESSGIMMPVVEAHCQYFLPAHYDDLLRTETTLAIEKARIRIAYRLCRDADLLAEGYTLHVCMDSDGKAIRPPPALTRMFR